LDRARVPLSGAIIGVCVMGLFLVVADMRERLEKNAKISARVDAVIDSFLQTHPNGLVVCARDESYSKYCTAAFAFNRYRSPDSRAHLTTKTLYGGKVIWLSRDELAEPPARHFEVGARPVLVVGQEKRLKRANNPAFDLSKAVARTDDYLILRLDGTP
jgi:hypothetical protein